MLDWNAATGTSLPFFCTRLRIMEADGATAPMGCFRISGIDAMESIPLGVRDTIIVRGYPSRSLIGWRIQYPTRRSSPWALADEMLLLVPSLAAESNRCVVKFMLERDKFTHPGALSLPVARRAH